MVIPCTIAEREYLRSLVDAHGRTERDVRVAFTVFCAAHGLASGTELEAVSDAGVVVKPVADP